MAANIDFPSPSTFLRLLRQLRMYAGIIYRVDWLAMFIFARFEIVQKYAGRERNPGAPSPQAAAESAVLRTERPVREIVRRITADGIADGLRLNEDTVDEVISFAACAPCYGNAEFSRLLDRCPCGCLMPADAVVGDYLDGIADCDAITRLWRDSTILAIAGASLGTRPFPLRSRLWWSFRADRATPEVLAVHSQDCFHFDLDAWRAVKFFFYITEVGPENGPHMYVWKSHRNRPMRDQLSPFKSRSSRRITAKYGRDNLAVMHGPAGTGFVEDPYGFHTGTVVTGDPRLILEIEYGVSRTPLVGGPFYVPAIELS
jgi:phytanoyl-CoA dioxygenase PhyH